MIQSLREWAEKNAHFKQIGRYFPPDILLPFLKQWDDTFSIVMVGRSVEGRPIHKIEMGSGPIRILMWSQMHGNESTTTKAIIPLLQLLSDSDNEIATRIWERCTITLIPMLNPDGAAAYTRANANEIDLNRDAQDLSQPESKVLRQTFNDVDPDFCFNLHGQRTIYGVGETPMSAAMSFLTPAENYERTITKPRKSSMNVVADIYRTLHTIIPGHIGRYDDTHNINCVGDTFQSLGKPTILFEAGHYPNDYLRHTSTELTFYAMVAALNSVATHELDEDKVEAYHQIPQNKKSFNDFVLRDASTTGKSGIVSKNLCFQFKEVLKDGRIRFVPEYVSENKGAGTFFHKEFDFADLTILNPQFQTFSEEVDIVEYLRNFKEMGEWLSKIQ